MKEGQRQDKCQEPRGQSQKGRLTVLTKPIHLRVAIKHGRLRVVCRNPTAQELSDEQLQKLWWQKFAWPMALDGGHCACFGHPSLFAGVKQNQELSTNEERRRCLIQNMLTDQN